MAGFRQKIVDPKDALRIILEDPEIALFLLKHFSQPERRPMITTRTFCRHTNPDDLWIVEILERDRSRSTLNAVIASIHPEGKIIEKKCLSSLFDDEYSRCVRPLFFSNPLFIEKMKTEENIRFSSIKQDRDGLND